MTLNVFIPNTSSCVPRPCLFLEWELGNYLDQAPCNSHKEQADKTSFRGLGLASGRKLATRTPCPKTCKK